MDLKLCDRCGIQKTPQEQWHTTLQLSRGPNVLFYKSDICPTCRGLLLVLLQDWFKEPDQPVPMRAA